MAVPSSAPKRDSQRVNSADLVDVLRLTAVFTLLGAAVIHASVTSEHFQEWGAAGVFFVVITVAEAGLGVLLVWTPRRDLYLVALAVSAATVLVWAVSRTTGLPFGPEAGTPEGVGRPDTISTLFELATVVVTVPLVGLSRLPTFHPRGNLRWVAIALVAALVLTLATVAVASPDEEGSDHAVHSAELLTEPLRKGGEPPRLCSKSQSQVCKAL
jgi:hypothetical protein